MRPALPTWTGFLFLTASALSTAAAFINPGLAAALTAAVVSAITAASWLLAQISFFGFQIEREGSLNGTVLEYVAMPVTVINKLPFYRQAAVLKEMCPFAEKGFFCQVIPPLAPHQRITLNRTVRAVRRGHFNLLNLTLIVGDPAGLFRKSIRIKAPGEITISPRVIPLPELPLQTKYSVPANSDGRPLRHAGSGYDFFGVRPYRSGDEIRFIHWRATANHKNLMVKELEANTIDRIAILLDTDLRQIGLDSYENNLEMLITCAASIVSSLSKLYCRLSFFTNFEKVPVRLFGDAAGIRQRIMDILTELKPSAADFEKMLETILERMEPGSILYVFSMSSSPQTAALLELLADNGIHIRWYCAPKFLFPKKRENKCRSVNPRRIPADTNRAVKPVFLTFDSNLSGVFRS